MKQLSSCESTHLSGWASSTSSNRRSWWLRRALRIPDGLINGEDETGGLCCSGNGIELDNSWLPHKCIKIVGNALVGDIHSRPYFAYRPNNQMGQTFVNLEKETISNTVQCKVIQSSKDKKNTTVQEMF